MRCPTLTELPPPPEGKTGWPWTEETPQITETMPDGQPWPKVSIITPSYNQGQFIEETIRSVLLQGYPDFEYIVIDGGSTDKSVEIIRKYERWIAFWTSERDSGQTNAINKGFKRSSGKIVAWLNSDDLYTKGAFFVAVKTFVKQPHSTVIYGNVDTIDANSSRLSTIKSHKFSLEKLYASDYIQQPASFIRAETIVDVGYLDERFQYAMDYDLWIRIGQKKYIMQYIPVTLAWFRLHNCSKCVSQQEAFWPEEFILLDRSLKHDALETPLAEIAYSHIFQLLIFGHISGQSYKIIGDGITQDDDEREAYYQQPLQEILRLINIDDLDPDDKYPLPKALHGAYQALDNKYNTKNSRPKDLEEARWVDKQLLLLPRHLLSLGEKTKSVKLYKKIIQTCPYLLKYPQTYKFVARYIVDANFVSRIRRTRIW